MINKKGNEVYSIEISREEDIKLLKDIEKFGKIRATDLFRKAMKDLLTSLKNKETEAFKLLK